jgi:hypothetical protein
VPEVNEHGFYYNQPYAAFVEYFGASVALFIREDNTLDAIMIGYTDHSTETCSYVIDGDSLIATSATMGELHFTVSSNGAEIYNAELATTFALGNESIVADEDYIYVYKEDVVGYEVVAIDKTKSYYSPIRTNINGIATVRLTDNMFYDWNTNKGSEMTESPIIPDTVITIGQQAFYSNNNLKTVNIPSSVEKICVGAFGVCRTLTDVVFGENSRLVEIEEKAFSGCYDLVNIVIPATVEDIGGYAFSHCSVENIILPNVGVLSDDAFSSCHNLTSVTIGNSVTTICKQVFAGCDKLTNINYMGTVAEWNQIVFFGSAESDWNYQVPATYVQCSDGQVPLV